MTLAGTAAVLAVAPKWIQNALSQLGLPLVYPEARMRQLGLARHLVEAGFSLPDAWELAGQALGSPDHSTVIPPSGGIVRLSIDVPRYLTDWAAAWSRVAHVDPPRGRGRPRKPAPGGGVAAARAYGIDVAGLAASLRKTPAERLRALDANQRFAARLRRRAMSLPSMISGLNQAKVHFVVIGGVAATAHGSLRVTNDLDICYDPVPDNRKRLARLLASWHGYPRGAERGLPFVMDAVTLSRAPVLTLTTDQGDLDCFDAVAGVGPYVAVEKSSERVAVDRLAFRVLQLPALIKAKRAAGRPKDREALLELAALRELRRRE